MASVVGERAQVKLRDFSENHQIFVTEKIEYLKKKPLYEMCKRLFDVVMAFRQTM